MGNAAAPVDRLAEGLTPPSGGASWIAVFRIRTAQVAAFQEDILRAFVRDMVLHLRREAPAPVAHLDDDALARSLRRRLEQAIAQGVTERRDARRYLRSSYVLGWTDDGPDEEARAVLVRGELEPEQKVDLIERRAASV